MKLRFTYIFLRYARYLVFTFIVEMMLFVQLVGNCQECVMHLPSLPKEPYIQTVASRPFEAVSVDLGQLEGVHYLILADRFVDLTVLPVRCLNSEIRCYSGETKSNDQNCPMLVDD